MKEFGYEKQYDVIVAGGGVSGTVAAIAAGRLGADVLILEEGAYLGGALTGCGVGPMMTFHAGEKQVIRGIMEEIVERLKTDGYSTGHIYDTMQYISYLTPFNSEGLKVVLDEMTAEAGCTVLFHTFIGAAVCGEGKIESLTVCNKDGIHSVSARVYIDGTGDGDVAAFAGAPMTKGRESDGAAQPMTMNMKYLNVDTEAIKEHIRTHIADFSRHQGNEELMDTVSRFSFCGFQDEFREARERGELEDILERRSFDSVIAHSAYPIDIHNPKGVGTDSRFLSEKGTYYSIPYETLYCEEIKNLLAAGRCISASFEAQAAIRTTPTAGALGHAAGVAAALAAKGDGDVSKVSRKELQKRLKEQGAYLDL